MFVILRCIGTRILFVVGEREVGNLKSETLLPGCCQDEGRDVWPLTGHNLNSCPKLWPYRAIKSQIDMVVRINMGEFSWLEN